MKVGAISPCCVNNWGPEEQGEKVEGAGRRSCCQEAGEESQDRRTRKCWAAGQENQEKRSPEAWKCTGNRSAERMTMRRSCRNREKQAAEPRGPEKDKGP